MTKTAVSFGKSNVRDCHKLHFQSQLIVFLPAPLATLWSKIVVSEKSNSVISIVLDH
jgi:hypothetical protein